MHVGVLTPRACADAVVLPGWRSAVRATFLRKLQCRGLAVGIDLGTTSSVLAVVDEAGRPHILEDARGRLAIPSLVYLTDHELLVGEQARNAAQHQHFHQQQQQQCSPQPTSGSDGHLYYSIKRLLGQT
ncbi:hypothetical protein V8C86DRAFT_2820469 [Haematococcus lacustris]